jgi:DamX protein
MFASAKINKMTNSPSSVINISVNARIDYIMRFSKQTVLVVDPQSECYSAIASEFIASLADDHNAAFLSISDKLNDIQIRCRLIEQLFVDTLFDPEQPLSTTLLKLSADKPQPISIIIEHAQHLSLQLLHELCQIVDVATKAKREINVLLVGSRQVASLAAKNSVVFDNKLAILSAQSAQLIALNSPELIDKKESVFVKHWQKFTLVFVLLAITSSLLVFFLSQKDVFTFTKIAAVKSNAETEFVTEKTKKPAVPVGLVASKETKDDRNFAKPSEIASFLTSSETMNEIKPTSSAETELPQAKVEDVLISIDSAEHLTIKPELTVSKQVVDEQASIVVSEIIELTSNNSLANNTQHYDGNESYYLSLSQGYVVQIIGFSTIDAYNEFIKLYPNEDFYHYVKQLNGIKLIVVTTGVYPLESDARAAKTLLPENLQKRGAWIKSLAAINNEISTFQSSQ